MESGKRKNLLITIFVITTIVAGCLATYFGIVKNNEILSLQAKLSELESTSNKENIEKDTSAVDVKKDNYGCKDIVYTYLSESKTYPEIELYNSSGKGKYIPYVNVRIPQIKGETETIKTINNRILNDTNDLTELLKKDTYKSASTPHMEYDYKYHYLANDQIVFINIFRVAPVLAGTTRMLPMIYKQYIYDVKNDKELSLKDFLSSKGITIDEIKKIALNNMSEYFTDPEHDKESINECINFDSNALYVDYITNGAVQLNCFVGIMLPEFSGFFRFK